MKGLLPTRALAQVLAVALATGILISGPTARATPLGGNGKIAFANHTESRSQIFTVDPDGSRPKRVTHDRLFDSEPSWAPGGHWIVYSCSRRGMGGGDICVIRKNGKDRRRLTKDKIPDGDPAWSPGGGWIAFAREPEDPEEGEGFQIFLMRRDGSKLTQLTNMPGAGAYYLAWAPDGVRLAFVGEPSSGNGQSIWVINRDGTGLEELTSEGEYDMSPSWSPDGSKIVFNRYVEIPDKVFGAWTLFTMDADGSDPQRLGKGRKSHGLAPVWSPNGKKIAFQDSVGASDPDGIYVIRADGTGKKRIYYDGTGSVVPDWLAEDA